VGPTQEDAHPIVASLEGRFLELKARLDHEDEEQKQQTLDELNRLINEIGLELQDWSDSRSATV
jgi:hypothetical protein